MEHLQDGQRDAVEVAGLLVAVELDGVEAEACGDSGHLSRRSVGEDAHEERPIARGVELLGRRR